MLEKTVLQQLQEIFPMEVNREEADAGEKPVDVSFPSV